MHSEDDLGLSLSVVLRSYLDAASAVFEGVPAGARGYQVLSCVAHHALPSQAAIAQQIGIDRSVLTYLLDDLETSGLIERRPDPADRRARRIVLTRAGDAVVTKLAKRLAAAESHALGGLSAGEQQALRDLLWRASCFHASGTQNACNVVDEVAGKL